MKRIGHKLSTVPQPQGVRINQDSMQAQGLVGAWPLMQSRYQNIVRDLMRGNDATWATAGSGWGWQETDNPLGTGIYSPGGHSGGGTSYLDAGNSTALQITNEGLTISFWCRLYQVLGGNSFPGLVGKGDSDSNTLGSYLMYLNNAAKLSFFLWSGGARVNALTGTSVLNFQFSYHFAATWKPSTRVATYINGILESETTSSVAATVDNPNYNFLIATNQGGADKTKYNFRGVTHEARLYNRALSDSEIFQMYAPPTRWELYQSPQRFFGHPLSVAVRARNFPIIIG